jgi:thiamine-phosphate pyrophosphorylase
MTMRTTRKMVTDAGVSARIAVIHGLYAITDSITLTPETLTAQVTAAIEGGARAVQYRDKTSTPATRLTLARSLAALCRAHGVPLIINDDAELALASSATGVHLGREDNDVSAARRLLGPTALIGASCYDDLERARRAQAQGADYVAFGRFFPSRTKPQASPASLDILRRARAELALPIVAIGGITPQNGATLITAGAHALAVIDGLWSQGDVRTAAARYAELFRKEQP